MRIAFIFVLSLFSFTCSVSFANSQSYSNKTNALVIRNALNATMRQPANVTTQFLEEGAVQINWNPVTGASHYNILVRNPKGSGDISKRTIAGTKTTISGLSWPMAYLVDIIPMPKKSAALPNTLILIPDSSGNYYSRSISDNRLLPDQTKRDPNTGKVIAKTDGVCCNRLIPPTSTPLRH